MSSEHDIPKGNFGEPQPTGDPGAFTQEFQHSQVSARIPEKIGRGMFSTGALVLQGANEFVIDFLLTMMKPQVVAARVVLPPQVMGALINALNENYNNYKSKFGSPPAPPQPPPNQPPPKPPSIDEIYDQLKLPDEQLSGVYSNAVMISHTPAEFCFDFITNFYPRSAVSARVYLAAPQIPGLLNTLTRSFQQYQQKMQQPPPQPHHRPHDFQPPAN